MIIVSEQASANSSLSDGDSDPLIRHITRSKAVHVVRRKPGTAAWAINVIPNSAFEIFLYCMGQTFNADVNIMLALFCDLARRKFGASLGLVTYDTFDFILGNLGFGSDCARLS